MKVNILGTEYEIFLDVDPDLDKKLEQMNGYMDFSIKKIVVAKFETDRDSIENPKYFLKKVLRHELTHAFLYESGLWENSNAEAWAQSEEMTDWIAVQFPKLLKAFQECDCI